MKKPAVVSLALVAAAAVIAWNWFPALLGSSDDPKESLSGNPDIPVVVPVRGGMLEVAHLRGSRVFRRATIITILGKPLPICKETASLKADYHITYRISLGKQWPIRYTNGTLIALAPELDPLLPVAIDTNSIRDVGEESCWFLFDQGTRDRVLAGMSADLQRYAEAPSTKDYAHAAASEAITTFLRSWANNQKTYPAVPRDARIKVLFPGDSS